MHVAPIRPIREVPITQVRPSGRVCFNCRLVRFHAGLNSSEVRAFDEVVLLGFVIFLEGRLL
jgi:hypothetical protein